MPQLTMPQDKALSSVSIEADRALRPGEKLILAFYSYAVVASLFFPLALRERVLIAVVNVIAGALIVSAGKLAKAGQSRFSETVRDWMPCILVLLAYRESGLFFAPDPAHRLDHLFIRLDDALLGHSVTLAVLEAGAPWIQRYLEFSYFLCYPMVPLGVATLYLARRLRGRAGNLAALSDDALHSTATSPCQRAREDDSPDRPCGLALNQYWIAVLLASLTCYAVYPFFPLTPPRELFHDLPGPAVAPLLRNTNFWLLKHYSVSACLFPSAHVASVTAAALVIRRYLPRIGALFLIAAASIALATVYGRYHYAVDAVAGALVGGAAHLVSEQLRK